MRWKSSNVTKFLPHSYGYGARVKKNQARLIFFFFCMAMTSSGVLAGDLVVMIEHDQVHNTGKIGCALFDEDSGFPLEISGAIQIWSSLEAGNVVCRFSNLPEGNYAVAAYRDQNDNQKVDANLLGMPSEDWGVSNNVRPKLRAPRFDEAKFLLEVDQIHEITIKIRKGK